MDLASAFVLPGSTDDLPATPEAPGYPGMAMDWVPGPRQAFGGGLGPGRLWFSIADGILAEVYSPDVAVPKTRDLGFIIADGRGFWVEVRRLPAEVTLLEPGVPVLEVVHRHERFVLRQRICADPRREVLLLEVHLDGEPDLRPYVLLAPRLGTDAAGAGAWAERHGYRKVLTAQGPAGALALAASDLRQQDAFGPISAGYCGHSDGWQDFSRHGAMRSACGHAGPGHVALTGALPPWALLSLGFAAERSAAATLALCGCQQRFDDALARQLEDWRAWHNRCEERRAASPLLGTPLDESFATSAMVLRLHLDHACPGSANPNLGLPRTGGAPAQPAPVLMATEIAGGLLAAGACEEARDIFRHLVATQAADGGWTPAAAPGDPNALVSAALPVLLATALSERGALEGIEPETAVERALAHLILRGPFLPVASASVPPRADAYAMAQAIAALVAGSRFLQPRPRAIALAVADFWNSRLDRWCGAFGTPLPLRHGLRGYFDAAAGTRMAGAPLFELIGPLGRERVGTAFMHLVRLGLRRADDPLIMATLGLLDRLLPTDPGLVATGQACAWSVALAERAHYEVCQGADPLPYLRAMHAQAGPTGLLPVRGDGHGAPRAATAAQQAASPSPWAHAEFLKLSVSREMGRPFDRPPSVWRRYASRVRQAAEAIWTPRAAIVDLECGQDLTICLARPARVRYGFDAWTGITETTTRAVSSGLQAATLPCAHLRTGQRIQFTLQWLDTSAWLGEDYALRVSAPPTAATGEAEAGEA